MKTTNSAQVICITGGTRGLGRAMVGEFIANGAVVAACGRNPDAIKDLRDEFGPKHIFRQIDVTDEIQVEHFSQQVINDLGPPDYLINNAAIINPNAPLWEISAGDFSKLIDINVKGVANGIRSFAPAMIQRGSGVFVNFSSGWGRSTSAEVAPYCASKYAIEGLSSAFAQELPAGLASIALNPGMINTDMLQAAFGVAANDYPSPESWAKNAVPYILSLGARENGQSLSAPY